MCGFCSVNARQTVASPAVTDLPWFHQWRRFFPPPQQVDSQGSFTFTFTIDSMFCGYNGQINTYDFGGDGQLLTSNPLAVVC